MRVHIFFGKAHDRYCGLIDPHVGKPQYVINLTASIFLQFL